MQATHHSDPDQPEPHPIDRYIAERREAEPRYSKQALADEVGVSRNAIYRVMSGDDAVSTDLLEKIEAATGISSVDLFAAWKAARDKPKAGAN
jgi:transcriptional regulator with XRE-family HTH domain